MSDNKVVYAVADRAGNNVILLDVENCPSYLDNLPSQIEHCTRIVLCYAQSGAKVPLDWMLSLAPLIVSGKLSMVKMDKPGKNAADFGICFLAGSLMQELPKDTYFTIMSNDTDLDYVVQMLKRYGRGAERQGTSKQTQSMSDDNSNLQHAVTLYCNYLLTGQRTRPAKTETLKNSIKSQLKEATPLLCESVLNSLLGKGAVTLSGKKVSYCDKLIHALAKEDVAHV